MMFSSSIVNCYEQQQQQQQMQEMWLTRRIFDTHPQRYYSLEADDNTSSNFASSEDDDDDDNRMDDSPTTTTTTLPVGNITHQEDVIPGIGQVASEMLNRTCEYISYRIAWYDYLQKQMSHGGALQLFRSVFGGERRTEHHNQPSSTTKKLDS